MVRGVGRARARGRRRQRLPLGPRLPPFAGLILRPARGARRTLGRLPPRSSREPPRPGRATPAPHSAPPCGRRRVPSGARGRKNSGSPRAGARDWLSLHPRPCLSPEQESAGRGQVQTASRLLTALPARRPLKRKREGETARLRKSPPSRVAPLELITAGAARAAGPPALSGSCAPLRHPAPPRSPRTGLWTCGDQAFPPTHTPSRARPRELRTARRGLRFVPPSTRAGRGWGRAVARTRVVTSGRGD